MFCWESCERATHLNIVAGLTQQDKSLRKTLKHHSRFPRSQSGWASVGWPGTRLVNEGSDCQPVQSTRPATKSNIIPPSALSTLRLVSEQSCSWTVYFIALRKLIIWNSNQDFLFFFSSNIFSAEVLFACLACKRLLCKYWMGCTVNTWNIYFFSFASPSPTAPCVQ